jgi:hypothetical protein
VDEHAHVWTVAFIMVESEKQDAALIWALSTLLLFFPGLQQKLRTVFTDRGVSQAVIHHVFGPNVAALVCTFHIGMNMNSHWGRFASFDLVCWAANFFPSLLFPLFCYFFFRFNLFSPYLLSVGRQCTNFYCLDTL